MFLKRATHNMIFYIFFFEIASKLEKVGPTFSSFNLFPSLLSVPTNDSKQNKHHNIVLNNKPRPLFWEFSWGQDIFGISKIGPTFSSFNLFPSLLSVATNDKKQNKRHNVALDHYFWNSDESKTYLRVQKDAKIAWHSPFKYRYKDSVHFHT